MSRRRRDNRARFHHEIPMDRHRLTESLKAHEGLELTPYLDTTGNLTVGYGHNLNLPIGQAEADAYLDADIDTAIAGAKRALGEEAFEALDDTRQEVLVEMAFNLGGAGLAKFRNALAAVREGDYVHAASEMLDSLWARQVGGRAEALATRMSDGELA